MLADNSLMYMKGHALAQDHGWLQFANPHATHVYMYMCAAYSESEQSLQLAMSCNVIKVAARKSLLHKECRTRNPNGNSAPVGTFAS